MTPNQAREAILTAFIAAWGSPEETPFVFDNETYEPENGEESSWVALSIREADSAQETLGPVGARRYKREGVAQLSIFALPDRGSQRADELVKLFRDAFEGVTLTGGVYFTDCQVQEIGIEGVYYRVNALAVFWFSETK